MYDAFGMRFLTGFIQLPPLNTASTRTMSNKAVPAIKSDSWLTNMAPAVTASHPMTVVTILVSPSSSAPRISKTQNVMKAHTIYPLA